jgi:hypothetical protein
MNKASHAKLLGLLKGAEKAVTEMVAKGEKVTGVLKDVRSGIAKVEARLSYAEPEAPTPAPKSKE